MEICSIYLYIYLYVSSVIHTNNENTDIQMNANKYLINKLNSKQTWDENFYDIRICKVFCNIRETSENPLSKNSLINTMEIVYIKKLSYLEFKLS